jgi:hypothetical protein
MSSEKSNGVSSPYDSLKNVLHQLTTLASKPELQNAASMFDEIDHQKRQIKAKEEDLAKGQSQNQAAIEAIMGVNEKLKIEQKSIETEKSSLQNNLRKKEKGTRGVFPTDQEPSSPAGEATVRSLEGSCESGTILSRHH